VASDREVGEDLLILDAKYCRSRSAFLSLAQMSKILGSPENVDMIINTMIKDGFKPCSRSYSIRLGAWREHGSLEGVESVMKDMKNDGFTPEKSHFEIIMLAYAESQKFDKALKWLLEMKRAGFVIADMQKKLKSIFRQNGLESDEFEILRARVNSSHLLQRWADNILPVKSSGKNNEFEYVTRVLEDLHV
jgi:pentatricopeptide repeat protein